MATATNIQVSGQLGLETANNNAGGIDSVGKKLKETTTVPHYVTRQEYPETGEVNQSILTLSGLGILLIFLLTIASRKSPQKK